MKKIINKILRIVATFLGACGVSCTFVACYGMPVDFDQEGLVDFFVFEDVNKNGEFDEGEPGVGGVKITDNDSKRSNHTNAEGWSYLWSDVTGEKQYTVDPTELGENNVYGESRGITVNVEEIVVTKVEVPLVRKNAD